VEPADPWLHGYEATCHRVLAAYDRGVEAAGRALDCPGADDPVLGSWLFRERGDCRRQWGEGDDLPEKLEEGLVDFEQAADVAGDTADSLIFEYWGHTLVALERFAEALEKFDAALSHDSDGAWPQIGKGKAHYFLGDLEKAEAAFAQVVASGAEDLKVYGNVGRGLALAGREAETEAEEAFAAALGEEGGAGGYYERAERFVYLRAFERAESDFRQAIALDGRHADALNELAWLFVHDWPRPDRLEEAYDLARKAVAVDPDAPSRSAYLDTAGWIALKLGRGEEARELLAEAVSLNPHDVVIRSHHAEMLAALENREEALSEGRRRA
jgi:tetratricopeptide (TPR) repeat protein